MSILSKFQEESKKLQRIVVLPEGFDERTLKAASEIYKNKISKLVILGNEKEITDKLISYGLKSDDFNNDKLTIINHQTSKLLDEFVNNYYDMRKSKGMTLDEAKKSMNDPLFFGAMLVRSGKADGMVAGAANTTGDVLRAALRIVGVKPGINTVSSCFIMVTQSKHLGANGVLLFSDCAVNPEPTAEMVADIAISTAENCRQLLDIEPVVGLLSFSTKGSAVTPSTEKMALANKILQEKNVDFLVDGEMQLDAAVIKEIGNRKAPESGVAGRANVLIFPNLDASNIGYKLVERFSNTEAVGPIIQGLSKPINDLSRGCSYEDIVNLVAITSVQVK